MTVHEPATLLTDYLLAVLAGGLAWRLRSRRAPANRAQRWWTRLLVLTALSALVGGSYHGFGPNFPLVIRGLAWIATLELIVLIAAALELSLLYELAPARPRVWQWLIGLKVVALSALILWYPVFLAAIVAYGLSLLAWIAAALFTHRPWRGWILGAIALSIVAAAVQQLGWDLSDNFNHNDVYHLLQAVALIAFYRAGLLFGR